MMRLPTAPSPSVGFFDLGMDSLMAVEFRNRLNRAFAGEYVVSNTAVFDFPDITQLSQHLSEELGQVGTRVEPEATPAIAPPAPPPFLRSGGGRHSDSGNGLPPATSQEPVRVLGDAVVGR